MRNYRNRIALVAAAAFAATSLRAGGFVTNTNQNAAFGRNLSQEAQIDVTSVYANPAGVAFLNKGWHLALNVQSAFQTRTPESWFIDPEQGPFLQGTVNGKKNTSATKTYDGKATAPFVPSFDLSYVADRWSLAAHFAVTGGGGKCEFNDGLGSFESKVALLPAVMNALSGQNSVTGYSMDTYMRGKQYYFGGQINATYKVTDNLSLALGVRGVYAMANYYGYVSNIKAVLADGTRLPVADAMKPMVTQLATAVPELAPVMNQIAGVAGDVRLNCDQKGFGVTPIIGIDWRINDHWNVAAKYEFKTRLRLENESGESESGSALAQLDEFADGKKIPADIPALLTLGVQYSPIDAVRINAGGHVFFDKQATQYNNREKLLDGPGWEITAGAEYDVCDWATISAGWQTTHYGLGDTGGYITDMSFVTNSNSIGIGARFQITKHIGLDVSYFKTLYRHYDKYQSDYNGISSNFSSLLGQVGQSVQAIATDITTQDIAAGVDPTTDPRLTAISSLSQKMQGIAATPTPGHDRLFRTNDVIGIGLVVDF